MSWYIKNYNLGPRIAVVKHDCYMHNESLSETMELTEDNTVKFMSDGKSIAIEPDNRRLFTDLLDGDIVTIDDRGVISRLYDSLSDEATVFMTGQCNSNCIMCPASDNERKFNRGLGSDWLAKYIELLPNGIDYLVITGGEPTLNPPLFFSTLRRLKERFPDAGFLLLSNGRSFVAKKMITELLLDCPKRLRVAIPIHGDTASLHDSISRVEGSFSQTTKGVTNLLENNIEVELRIVVSKLNYRSLNKIATLISQDYRRAIIVNFIGLETLGNCAKYLKQVFIDYVDAFPYIKTAAEILISSGIDVSLYNFPLCTVEPGFWSLCSNSITPSKIRYAEICSECDARSFCGGVFGSTLSAAKPKLSPVHLKQIVR